MGGDFATGAAAAGANEALIEHLSNGLGLDNTTDQGRELEKVASQLIGLVAAGLVEGDLQQGSDIAKNATAFNGQLHTKQKEFAREAAAQSEGEFTVEQLESQLRRSFNLEEGLHPGRDIVSTEDTKYDLGGVWVDSADGIHQVQLLDDPDIEAIQYLMSFDRGYTWGSQDLGILPDQQSMPNVSWPISSGDSPLLLNAELNGISFTLALQSFEVATKGSSQLEAGLKFNPGAYNYSPVDVGGKTYYMGLVVIILNTIINIMKLLTLRLVLWLLKPQL